MWVRKEIEISLGDLLRGWIDCFAWTPRAELVRRIHEAFGGPQAVPCLSVRSGFDALLASSGWAPESEVLLSGLTIPDMPRIVCDRGFRPIGVDLHIDTLAPDLEQLRRAITPRTKAIVVAHLFGGLVDLEPVAAIARAHGLLLIEDCAQAFVGSDYAGDPRADVSMFSFGPIKTNTALGGGILIVRQPAIQDELLRAQEHFPRQSRWGFAKRLLKYSYVRWLSTRWIAGAIATALRWAGTDHDRLATNMARGFPGPKFFEKIRQQPSQPLLRMLARKLNSFSPRYIEQRAGRGNQVASRLTSRVDVLGSQTIRPTYWVLPILVDHRRKLVEQLWRLGFDATTSSSLKPVGSELTPAASLANLPNCQFILDHLVFLPFDVSIPDEPIDLMVRTILQGEYARPKRPAGAAPKTLVAGSR